jgi:hypothetical protein
VKRLGSSVRSAVQAKAEASSAMPQYHHAAGRSAAWLLEPVKEKAFRTPGRYQKGLSAVKQSGRFSLTSQHFCLYNGMTSCT